MCLEILNNKIDAPVSRRGKLGVKIPLQNLEEHILDTWYGGPAGYISASIDWASKSTDKHKWKSYWLSKETKWVAFVGFDCTFSHGIFYPGMLMAQAKYVYPDTVVTNKFYGLDGQKVSTSRNHAIWGDDIFSLIDPDVVRLYLSSTAPENNETDFKVSDFKQFVNDKLGDKWNNWLVGLFDISSRFGSLRTQPINAAISTENYPNKIKGYLEQIAHCFDTEEFSLQKIARSILAIANEGILHFNYITRNLKIDAVELEKNLTIVRLLGITSSPIMPGFSEKIKNVFQEDVEIDHSYIWDDIYKEVKVSPQKINASFFDKYDDITFEKLISGKKATIQ